MAVKLSSLSLEYIRYSVSAEVAGAQINPTTFSVQFAFIPFATDADPVSGDWVGGTWETDPGPPPIYYARVLVGPAGTKTLAIGKYHVWIKVSSSPDIPVRIAGVLQIV